MNIKTVQACLGALKKAGSVFGVVLTQENQVIYSDVPFAEDRVSSLATVLDDISFYFKKEHRNVDQLSLGFDGGSIVVVSDDAYRVAVFHSVNEEVDFIAKAAKTFLLDFQMGLFANEFQVDQNQERAIETVSPEPKVISAAEAKAQEALRPATQRITLKAETGFDETQPLQPRPTRAH